MKKILCVLLCLTMTFGLLTGTPITAEAGEPASASTTPLTFTGEAAFSISAEHYWGGTMEYSTDGSSWTTWDGTAVSAVSDGISYKLMFRGSGNDNVTHDPYSSKSASWTFTGTTVAASGNIMMLFDYESVAAGTEITMVPYALCKMFSGWTGLTSAPELPAMKLSDYCYSLMFNGCTSLAAAPNLPATTLNNGCYSSMFMGCTGLTTVQATLPAMSVPNNGYSYMFSGCTSLTTGPELPATSLEATAYAYMFNNCSNLVSCTSELPALNADSFCYQFMFCGCSKLAKAPVIAATTVGAYTCYNMFYGCSALTKCPVLPAASVGEKGYSFMFAACTGIKEAPALPALTLGDFCYLDMFTGCSNLVYPSALPATTLAKGCYEEMYRGTKIATLPKLSATTMAERCYWGMFYNCKNIKLYENGAGGTWSLPATLIAATNYADSMFNGIGCSTFDASSGAPTPGTIYYYHEAITPHTCDGVTFTNYLEGSISATDINYDGEGKAAYLFLGNGRLLEDITVPAGKTLRIDLKGNTLDMNGHAIRVYGSLELVSCAYSSIYGQIECKDGGNISLKNASIYSESKDYTVKLTGSGKFTFAERINISGNSKGPNLLICNGAKIDVNGMTNGSSVYVTMDTNGVFSTPVTDASLYLKFSADTSGLSVILNASKCLKLGEFYTVEVETGITNGTVSSVSRAEVGEKVEITAEPKDISYYVSEVYYNDGTKHAVEKADGKYAFTMPKSDVTVGAAFTSRINAQPTAGNNYTFDVYTDDATSATYQWYEVASESVPVTDKTAGLTFNAGSISGSVISPVRGRMSFFTDFAFATTQTLKVTVNGTSPSITSVRVDGNSISNFTSGDTLTGKTFMISGWDFTLTLSSDSSTYTPITGQTSKTLVVNDSYKGIVCGCNIDGQMLYSDPVTVSPVIPEAMENAQYFMNLAIADDIAMIFSIKDYDATSFDYKKLVVTANGTEYSMKAAIGGGLTAALANMTAQKMGDEILVKVVYDGIVVKKFTYSIKKYCENMLASATYGPESDLGKLCIAALNYGAAAQAYTGYKTDALVNANWVDADLDATVITGTSESGFTGSTGITAANAGLILGSKVDLQVTLSAEAGTIMDGFAVTDLTLGKAVKDGVSYSDTVGGFVVNVKDIPANYLWHQLKISACGAELKYGVYDYLKTIADAETDSTFTAELKTLAKALYLYGEAAKAYSANQK